MSGASRVLRKLISRPGLILAPGAYDALSAKLIETVGFKTIYMTGSGVAASQFAFPDMGLVMLSEMVEQAKRIVSAVRIPVIADADTGYGGPLNIRRTVREFENIGVAAIHLEDQEWPKRCGHFPGKKLVTKEEMVGKIQAAVDAKQDQEFIIIARTDAIKVEGLDSAIVRGKAYIKAGADILFFDSPDTLDQVAEIPRKFRIPLLINNDLLGDIALLTRKEIEGYGYKIAIYPGVPQFPALQASRKTLEQLMMKGILDDCESYQSTAADFLELTHRDQAVSWEKKHGF